MTLAARLALLTIAIAACSGDGRDGVSREDCEKLREHAADLALASSAPMLSAEERSRHRANLSASSGNESIEQCLRERSQEYLDCALSAGSVEALKRCDRAK